MFIIVLRTPFIEVSMVVVHSSFGKVTTENREKDSETIEIDSVQTVQTILKVHMVHIINCKSRPMGLVLE